MPEGDILRRTARTLREAFVGSVLVRAELRWPDLAGLDLTGREVLAVESYGKHLLVRLDDARTLHSHLRMEGSWRLARTGSREAAGRGAFVRAVLANERWTAVGDRLGMMHVVPTRDEHTLLGHLGPDVLADDFPTVGLAEARRRLDERLGVPIGEVLLDQRVVAGIGTMFAAESLWAREVWPWLPAGEVTDPVTLLMAARRLMERSVLSAMPTATGEGGRGPSAWVHDRAGKPCRRCRTAIVRGVVRLPPTERPMFWCPSCQPRPAGSGDPVRGRPVAPAGT